jgi:hypothetical protein
LQDEPGLIGARLAALAEHLAASGVDVIASDAEVPAGDGTLARALEGIGFRSIPEIQPSRHRVSLALPSGADDAAARSGISKSTRQRIDAAERSGIIVRRYDQAGWDGSHPLFDGPDRPLDTVLGDFATLLEATGGVPPTRRDSSSISRRARTATCSVVCCCTGMATG